MKRILTAIVLVAIATAALRSLGLAPTAKASSNVTVYLPLAMGGSGGQTSTPTPEPTPTHVDPAQLKADVVTAVNVERQKAGCALVAANVDLASGAQMWSDYLAAHNTLSHSFALDADWYLHHGYTRTDWLYENIAGGTDTGAQTVALWMSDEGHKAAILAGCANTSTSFDIGVGVNANRWTLAIGELYNERMPDTTTAQAPMRGCLRCVFAALRAIVCRLRPPHAEVPHARSTFQATRSCRSSTCYQSL